ncbi:MAG: FG-GAP-like repeat-containing protein [Pirellulaceae bacterium]|nr:VCBS repeat-containing protein [Planctomycetales bacterium]
MDKRVAVAIVLIVVIIAGVLSLRALFLPQRIPDGAAGQGLRDDRDGDVGADPSVEPAGGANGSSAVVPNANDDASFATLMNRAQANLENGLFDQSRSDLKRALAIEPDSAVANRNLARTQLLSGELDEALTTLRSLDQKLAEPSPTNAYLEGLCLARKGLYQEAVNAFERAAELNPQVAAVFFQLGTAYKALGQEEQALEQFRRTAELDPLHFAAKFQLAMDARRKGDRDTYSQLMRDYDRIRNMKGQTPNDPAALEACIYTEPEGYRAAQRRDGGDERLNVSWAAYDPCQVPSFNDERWLGLAVSSFSSAGRYQLIGVTTRGHVAMLQATDDGQLQLGAKADITLSGPPIRATVLVGNCLAPTEGGLDVLAEIAIVTPSGTSLLRYADDSGFTDLTEGTGLGSVKGDAARWVDLEHDGDIDLCVIDNGQLQAWQNNGDGTFSNKTEDFGLSGVTEARRIVAVDFDATNMGVDLAVASASRTDVYRNLREGHFQLSDAYPELPAADLLVCDDWDNDGYADLAILSAGLATMIDMRRAERQRVMLPVTAINDALAIDADNDGRLELVACGQQDGRPVLQWIRDTGIRWEALPVNVQAEAASAVDVRHMWDLDLDHDGDTDLLCLDGDNKIVALRNEGGNRNRQIKLQLHSLAGNPSSIGTRVTMRSDTTVVSRWTQRELPIEIGMGQHDHADSIQTLWANGVALNEMDVAISAEPYTISIIEYVRTSSCPFLYVWDGDGFQFVTDILGTAPLNVSASRGVPMPADSDEVIVLGPAARWTTESDGHLTLKVTTELREAIYLDFARLIAVDHPRQVAIASLDRTGPGSASGVQFVGLTDRRPPQMARWEDGTDLTLPLAAIDDNYVPCRGLLPLPVVGFTAPQTIELDFGEIDRTDDLAICLTGWFRFGCSSSNIAASQRSDVQMIWPRLEGRDAEGNWYTIIENLGFPTGNTKTIVTPIAERLREKTTMLRVTTTLEVRWDAIELCRLHDDVALSSTALEPDTAELAWHGFAQLRSTSVDRPQIPDVTKMATEPRWLTTLEGWYTRYGDVLPLVADDDQQMALLNSGDGVTLKFPTSSLPAVGDGRDRTLLLYVQGWIKEGDPNAMDGQYVWPFPGCNVPYESGQFDWQAEYNTRWVPGKK